MPAFKTAIKEAKEEIDAIVSNSQAPSFSNTLEAVSYTHLTLPTNTNAGRWGWWGER